MGVAANVSADHVSIISVVQGSNPNTAPNATLRRMLEYNERHLLSVHQHEYLEVHAVVVGTGRLRHLERHSAVVLGQKWHPNHKIHAAPLAPGEVQHTRRVYGTNAPIGAY